MWQEIFLITFQIRQLHISRKLNITVDQNSLLYYKIHFFNE